MLNKTTLIGRITKDLELKQSSGGSPYTYFTVACDRFGDAEGADFIQCVAFGKTAENMTKYVGKGSQVAVDGRIQTNKFEKDGQTTFSMNVVANRVVFLDSKGSGQVEQGLQSYTPQAQAHPAPQPKDDKAIDYDDIPW